MFANITLTNVPGLARLLREGETLKDLMALSPEEILLRWFNYHLEKAGHHRRVKNFSEDIKVMPYEILLISFTASVDLYMRAIFDVFNTIWKINECLTFSYFCNFLSLLCRTLNVTQSY